MNPARRTPAKSVEVPDDLRQRILSPYRNACTYLQKMWIDFYEPAAEAGVVGSDFVGRGQFSIPESFYINDTGHFNAVEFNLCYNQIGYVFLAYGIERKLIPPMSSIDLAYYERQQLGGVLIVKLSSSFQSRMRAENFWAEISLSSAVEKTKLWLIDTQIRYWDEDDGRSEGDMRLVILKENARTA